MFILTDDDVVDLASQGTAAMNRIAALVRATARGPFGRRPQVPLDQADLTSTAIFDAMTAVFSGMARDGEALTKVVQRSVWREVKRAQRRHDREIQVDFSAESLKDILAIPPSQLQQMLAAEGLDAQVEKTIDLLFRDVKTAPQEARTRIDLITVDDELIAYLTKHPEHMYNMSPRRFEELVASLLRDLGYDVQLTGLGADGGVDIFATQKTGVGESLLIVDCKRYAPQRPVGVSIVRALFGITEQLRATMGLLATTSHFTQPAHEFQQGVRHRLTLTAYEGLLAWLQRYGHSAKSPNGR
jgi:HJR/Mrr/RecB family endonuclease